MKCKECGFLFGSHRIDCHFNTVNEAETGVMEQVPPDFTLLIEAIEKLIEAKIGGDVASSDNLSVIQAKKELESALTKMYRAETDKIIESK